MNIYIHVFITCLEPHLKIIVLISFYFLHVQEWRNCEGVIERTWNCDCFFNYSSFYRNKVYLFSQKSRCASWMWTRKLFQSPLLQTHRTAAASVNGGEKSDRLCSALHCTPPMWADTGEREALREANATSSLLTSCASSTPRPVPSSPWRQQYTHP